MLSRLFPLLFSLLTLSGCEREVRDLLYRAELFLRANPLLIYLAGGLAFVVLAVKALRVAIVVAVIAAALLLLRFLAGF